MVHVRASLAGWSEGKGRVIGNKATAGEGKAQPIRQRQVRLMRLAGPEVGGEVVGIAKRWESLGKGEEGSRTWGRVVAQKGAGQGLSRG